MLRRISPIRVLFVIIASLSCVAVMSGQALAQQMVGLQFETGQMDAALADNLRGEVESAFDNVDRWSFTDFEATRGQMNPVTRDCFTTDCLAKAGEATGAPAGLRIEMSGEAEIYDWTIDIWDLRNGEKLGTKEGACELCGHTEVRETFRASVESVLNETTLGSADEAEQPTQADTAEPEVGPGQVMLRISALPEDTEIYINDQLAGEGQVSRPVGPGSHEVRFQREEYGGLTETVVIDENTDGPVVLHIHLARTDPEAVEVATGVGPIDRLGDTRESIGWVATGTGAVLLGTGIYLTSIDGEAACDDNVPLAQCPDVYATGGAGMTMGVLGTALITSGVAFLTWELLAGEAASDDEIAPSETGEDGQGDDSPIGEPIDEPGTVSISPLVGPDAAGVFLRGSF